MVYLTESKMNSYDYKKWTEWFAYNNEHRLSVDFSQETGLSEEEKRLIFPSVRAFQKGEGSDGVCLMNTVRKFAENIGEEAYTEAMQWFVKEENWHSAYLKQYMKHYDVKSAEKNFLDKCFRKLRQAGGLKCEITVLVTAEMIALTYYDALAKSVASPALGSICRQMLHDELPHIMFQSYTLSHFRNNFADRFLRILLMEATLLFVWAAYHKVYEAGGYSFTKYFRENMGYLQQSIALTKKR